MKIFGIITNESLKLEQLEGTAKKLVRNSYEKMVHKSIHNAELFLILRKNHHIESSCNGFIVKALNTVQFKFDFDHKHASISNGYFGLTKIYYYFDNKKMVFGSELLPLIEFIGRDSLTINDRFIKDLVQFGYPIGCNTIYNEITSLIPNSRLFADGTIYNDVSKSSRQFNPDSPEELFLLEHDFVSAFPTFEHTSLLFLSGGLDSRLIMDVLSESYSPIDYVINYGFPETWNVDFAYKALEKLDIYSNYFLSYEITPEMIVKHYKKYLKLTEGLGNHSCAHLLYPLEKLAPIEDLIIYEGYMGDITLGGNHCYKVTNYLFSTKELFPFIVDKYHEPTGVYYGDSERFLHNNKERNSQGHKLFSEYGMLFYPFITKSFYEKCLAVPIEKRKDHLLYKKFLKTTGRNRLLKIKSTSLQTKKLWYRVFLKIAKHLPFIKNKRNKNYMDCAAWLRDCQEYRSMIKTALLSERTKNRGIFKIDIIKEAIEKHLRNEGDYSRIFGRLFDIEMMFRILVDGDKNDKD